MPYPTRNLGSRITAALLAYLVLTALLLTGTLYTQLNRLAHTQLNELGNALSAQVTETLKQPVINDDVISVQVILDNLLSDTPVIARATLYSSANRIIAQSQRPAPGFPLTPYTSPVNVDDNMLAQLRLELDEGQVLSAYHTPLWIAGGLWMLLSAGLAWYLIPLGRDYTRRIRQLNACFASGDGPQGTDLAALESSLAPFIADDTENPESDGATGFALLAIGIPNLPKWQAQLNVEHFSRMLARVDHLLDNHLSLFKGQRACTRDTSVVLEFSAADGEDALPRAINCANAFLHLAPKLFARENIPFDVRATAAFRQPVVAASPWFNDLERERCVERLLDILPLAGAGELVIDKESVDVESDLTECDIDDLSAAAVWQFRAYRGERMETFHRQIDFLSATQG